MYSNHPKVKEAATYVKTLFQQQDDTKLYFHNLAHTEEVVYRCQTLAAITQLDEQATILLLIAAWFHDTGYLFSYDKHEERSICIATDFLNKYKYSNTAIQIITQSIAATELGKNPDSKIASILKDADLSFGCTAYFFERGALLRKEWAYYLDKTFSDKAWEELQYNFIKNVQFWSTSAKIAYGGILHHNQQEQLKHLEKM